MYPIMKKSIQVYSVIPDISFIGSLLLVIQYKIQNFIFDEYSVRILCIVCIYRSLNGAIIFQLVNLN